jgi:hypothetical protein
MLNSGVFKRQCWHPTKKREKTSLKKGGSTMGTAVTKGLMQRRWEILVVGLFQWELYIGAAAVIEFGLLQVNLS